MKLLLCAVLALVCAVLLSTTTACMTIDPAGQVKMLLEQPAVQATLKDWAVKGSMHNPRLGFHAVTGGELYVVGLDAEGDISGAAGTSGIDPELLKTLTEIALEHGYVPPAATQPAAPAP